MKVRKNYWLDPELLKKAREALGTETETDTVSEALKRTVEGEQLVRIVAEGKAKYPDWGDPFTDPSEEE